MMTITTTITIKVMIMIDIISIASSWYMYHTYIIAYYATILITPSSIPGMIIRVENLDISSWFSPASVTKDKSFDGFILTKTNQSSFDVTFRSGRHCIQHKY